MGFVFVNEAVTVDTEDADQDDEPGRDVGRCRSEYGLRDEVDTDTGDEETDERVEQDRDGTHGSAFLATK